MWTQSGKSGKSSSVATPRPATCSSAPRAHGRRCYLQCPFFTAIAVGTSCSAWEPVGFFAERDASGHCELSPTLVRDEPENCGDARDSGWREVTRLLGVAPTADGHESRGRMGRWRGLQLIAAECSWASPTRSGSGARTGWLTYPQPSRSPDSADGSEPTGEISPQLQLTGAVSLTAVDCSGDVGPRLFAFAADCSAAAE